MVNKSQKSEEFLSKLYEMLSSYEKTAKTATTSKTATAPKTGKRKKTTYSQRMIDLIRMISTMGLPVDDIHILTGIRKDYLGRIVDGQVWKKRKEAVTGKILARKDGKLTYQDAEAIRASYREGVSQKELSKKYKISQCTVSTIVNNKSWLSENPLSKKTFNTTSHTT